jgi:hypothetical protein
VLMCILISILFLGGYLAPDFMNLINDLLNTLDRLFKFIYEVQENVISFNAQSLLDVIAIFTLYDLTSILFGFLAIFEPLLQNIRGFITLINDTLGSELLYSLIIGLKSSAFIFIFIWARASFPRIRFDKLMTLCWTVFLPILFGIIILVPCIVGSFDIFPVNVFTSSVLPLTRVNLSSDFLRGEIPPSADPTDEEFKQWFVGFTDAEGCFYVGISQSETKKVIRFDFSIKLHIADLKVLETIKSRLNCGTIQIYNTEDAASFRVGGVNQLQSTILPIFDSFPLNGVKHLNYLAFKEALLILTSKVNWKLT